LTTHLAAALGEERRAVARQVEQSDAHVGLPQLGVAGFERLDGLIEKLLQLGRRPDRGEVGRRVARSRIGGRRPGE
jgi:hypothetical protein